METLNTETINLGGYIGESIGIEESDPADDIKDQLDFMGIESSNFIENQGNVIV